MRRIFSTLIPYCDLVRLKSTEITLLATLPTCASIVLASDGLLQMLGLFILSAIGAVVVRSAGCTINDIFDRNIDCKVQRTKNRPLASGRLTVKDAIRILIPLVLTAGVLLLFTNMLTLYLSMICAVGAVLYPLMKRFFSCPQIFLGIVWNLGVLIGSAMAADKLIFGSVLMYIGCIFWTTAYDTMYAHQDKKYDAILGLGSTALKFGDKSRSYIGRLNTLTITMWLSVGIVSRLGWPYYVCMLVSGGIFYYQYIKADFDSPPRCMYMFKTNIYVGMLLFLGICLGSVI